eukprot:gene69610-biopygen44688
MTPHTAHPTAARDAAPLLEMRSIRKVFGAVTVLRDVSLQCRAGQVHAICGENGAGKSTLMKVLAGVVRPDAGMLHLDGREFRHHGPAAALDAGI